MGVIGWTRLYKRSGEMVFRVVFMLRVNGMLSNQIKHSLIVVLAVVCAFAI